SYGRVIGVCSGDAGTAGPTPGREYRPPLRIASLREGVAGVDLHALPAADLHLAGGEAARLAHVGGAAEVHLDLPARLARLRVVGRQLRRQLHRLARKRGQALRVADHHVAPREPRGMQPEVVRLRHAEGELVVLPRALPHQDLEALDL